MGAHPPWIVVPWTPSQSGHGMTFGAEPEGLANHLYPKIIP